MAQTHDSEFIRAAIREAITADQQSGAPEAESL